MVKVVGKGCEPFLKQEELDALRPQLAKAQEQLQKGTGLGNDFLGWVKLPYAYDKEEYARIQAAAERIRANSQALVVIGIGGSYLGAKGVYEFFAPFKQDTGVELFFIGNGLNGDAMAAVMNRLHGMDWSINVISKSGTTTEPAVAFRFFRDLLESQYGKDEASRRIFATTDKARGALKALADREGYETFVVPDNVGGRYSVLTAVGLLPLAAAGIDTDELLKGAQEMQDLCEKESLEENPTWQYAALRNVLYQKGKKIEILGSYESSFRFMGEWWKQLYGESEGKDGKGLFPASVELTADLHSMGQYIQAGERHLLETIVRFASSRNYLCVPKADTDEDGLNYLAGRDMDYLQKQAMDGTLLAHVSGGVPNVILQCGEKNERTLGQLIYFFEYACGISGYVLGVNPFDQPGVEAYKKNMFALLGKPGYEEQGKELRKQLGED